MKASEGVGKGDAPREGQYSKESQEAFGRGYERVYGRDCPTCGGRGYTYNNNAKREVCPICKGKRKVKA